MMGDNVQKKKKKKEERRKYGEMRGNERWEMKKGNQGGARSENGAKDT